MANVNANLLSALLQIFNTTTNLFEANAQLPTVSLPATVAFYESFFQVAAGGGTVVPLPLSPTWFAVVLNRNAGGGAQISVRHTASGGAQIAAADSLQLNPGGIWVYANPTETTGGLTGLTLISSAATSQALVALAS